MTSPRSNRYPDEQPPGITADGGDAIRTAAGTATAGRAFVTNRSTEARILAVSFLGVDADWLPDPTRSRVLMPGETVPMDFTLHPAVGTLSAKYPFAITVQAIDPASGQAMSSAAIADYALVVDAPGRVEVQVVPNEITRRLRGSVSIKVTNVGNTPENVRIEINSPDNVDFALAHEQIEVQPGASATVPAKIAIEPQLFGRPTRYSYTVTARGRGAARRTDAAITTRAVLGNTGPKFFAIIAIVALWAGLAITLIPTVVQKINQSGNSAQDNVAQAQDKALDKLRRTQTATPSAGASGAGGSKSGGSGSGGSGSGGSGSGGSGSGGSGGSGSGGSAAGASATGAQPVQFSGTMAGDAPAGVTVSMRPTSLVDEEAQGATGVGVNTDSFTELGKIPAEALTAANAAAPTPGATTSSERSTTTKSDGAWGFAKVTSPGYYLVTFAKPGFQSQRYVLDAASAASAEPMKVTLVPGKGKLSGQITGPGGAVGGATITLSDGTNTLASSSNSGTDKGAWSVDGLSTPGTYLVTASKDGLSTESSIVTLDAGGVQTANLDLKLNSATLTGRVYGPTTQRDSAPLGNVSVTAKSESTERTSTTITTGNLTGTYRLPDLPAGDYVITTQATGYLTQTRAVTIKEGEKTASLRTDLRSATAVVTGVVRGIQFDTEGKSLSTVGPVVGAGIILSSETNTYKVTTGSTGAFRLDGVAPGSYVLSAQFAGLGTAYADVEVEAGAVVRVPLDSLQLPAANNRDSSSITGFVTAATTPSGAIACPRGTPDCDITFTLRDTNGIIVSTNTADEPNYVSSPKTKAISTGPTPYSLYSATGLPTGIYRLTASAVGYLPTTVTVRVPANTVANAPTISLFPTNGLVGNVKSSGSLATDGPNPPYDTCVWAVPVVPGVNTPAPTGCADTPQTLATDCADTGKAQAAFDVIDKDSQQAYSLSGLCDGTYDVFVFTKNPRYVTSPDPVRQTLYRGTTVSYSPEVIRKGNVAVTLQTFGGTGVVPAKGATGTLTCGDVSTPINSSSDNAVTTVQGVTAGTVTCRAVATYKTASFDRTVSGVVVQNGQDASTTITLATPVGDVFGKLVTTYEGNTNKPVANSSVDLQGYVQNATTGKAELTTIRIKTNENGCFGVIDDGAVTASPSSPDSSCGSLTFTSDRSQLANNTVLLSPTLTVQFNGEPGLPTFTDDLDFTANTVKTITVLPKSVSTTTVKLQVDRSPAPLQNATITVTPVAANGAGTISATSDANGVITWHDSAIYDDTDKPNTENKASPGTYTLTASLPGYDDASGAIDCKFNTTSCTVTTALKLTSRASLSGTMTGILGATDTYGTKSYPTETLGSIVVTAKRCTDPASADPCDGPTISGTSVGGGKYNFTANGVSRSLVNGTYDVTFAASGYATRTERVALTAGQDKVLDEKVYLRQVSFSVSLVSNSQPYDCRDKNCTVTVKRLDTGQIVTLTAETNADGNVTGTFSSTSKFSPASYLVTATGDDLPPDSTSTTAVPRDTNPDTTSSFPYSMAVSPSITTVVGSVNGIKGQATAATGLNNVPVELGHLVAGAFVADKGADGTTPLITKTADSQAGAAGAFSFSNVPVRTYVARYNVGNSDYPRLDGYRSPQTYQTVTVVKSRENTFAAVTLDRVSRKTTLSITTTDANSDLTGTTAVTLKSTDSGSTALSPQGPVKSGKTYTWTFQTVPSGDYDVALTLPANHLGVPTNADGLAPLTCPNKTPTAGAASPARSCTSTSPLTVSGADTTTDQSLPYTLDEYALQFKVVAGPKLAADNNNTVPTKVDLKLTDDDDATPAVYSDGQYAVGATTRTTLWGRAAHTYTSTVTEGTGRWGADPASFAKGSATTDISLTQRSATVTVTVTNLPTTATDAKVTLNLPATATADPVGDVVDGSVMFSLMPYYDNVDVTLTYTYTDADGKTVTEDKTATDKLNIDSATESVTIDATP